MELWTAKQQSLHLFQVGQFAAEWVGQFAAESVDLFSAE